MENVKEIPNTSKSDLIIITPDELLKLGLFRDFQSSVSGPSQISNKCVSGLKQKISDKIKAAAQNANREVEDTSKQKEYKMQKRKREPITPNPETPHKSGIRTSGQVLTEKEKRHSTMRKSTSNKSTNESYQNKSMIKLENKNNKTVKNATVTNPLGTSMKILNSGFNSEKRFAIPQKQMAISKKPITSKSALNTNKSSTMSSKIEPEILNLKMNFPQMKSIGIGDKTISTSNNFYHSPKTNEDMVLIDIRNDLTTLRSSSSELELQQDKKNKKITDSQNKPSTVTKREEKGSSTIFDNIDSTFDSNFKVPKNNDQIKVKAPISSKLENRYVKDIVYSPKKEVNVISNTPVCLSTEELKRLTSKVKYSPENRFQSIGVNSGDELQIATYGIQKDAVIPKIEIYNSEENIIASIKTESERSVCSVEQFSDMEKNKEVNFSTNSKSVIISADNDDSKELNFIEEHKSLSGSHVNISSPLKLIKVKKKDDQGTVLEEPSRKDGAILFQSSSINKECNTVTDIECELQTKKEIIELPLSSPSNEILSKEKFTEIKTILENNIPTEKEDSNDMGTAVTLIGTSEIESVNHKDNSVGNKIVGALKSQKDTVEKQCMNEGRISRNKTGVVAVHNQKCSNEETQEQLGEDNKKSSQEQQPNNKMKCKEGKNTVTRSGQRISTINPEKNYNECLDYSMKQDKSVSSRGHKRRKKIIKYNGLDALGEDIKLQKILKTYSRKSKDDIVNKEKTVIEANIPSDMKYSNPKEFVNIEKEEPVSDIIEQNNEGGAETKTTQKKTNTGLSVSKQCGRKRKSVIPIFGEDYSTDSSDTNREIEIYDKNIENNFLVLVNPLQKSNELEDSKSVEKMNKNEDKHINLTDINKPNADDESKKDFNTTIEQKKNLLVTSLQDSLRNKLLGSVRNVKSKELSEERRKFTKIVDSRDTEDELKIEEKIKEIESCNKSKADDLNIISLRKSPNQVLKKVPKKRGRPRKNVDVAKMQDSECSMPSLKREQTGSLSNILEAYSSVNDSTQKRISQSDSQLSNKQDTDEHMPIKNKNIDVEMPVLAKYECYSQSVMEGMDSSVISVDKLLNENRKIDQSEDETNKNMQNDMPNLRREVKESSKTSLISSTSNRIVEAESTTSSIPKIPRKRGRSRKQTTEVAVKSLEDGTDRNMDKTYMKGRSKESTNVEETQEKMDLTVSSAPEDEPTNNICMDEPLRGRKRKRINYFEMENSIEIRDSGSKRRRKTFPLARKLSKKSQNITPECQKKEDDSKLEVFKKGNLSSQSLDQEESDLTESCSFSQSNIDEEKNDEFDTTKQDESDSSTNIKEKKKSKSKKGGETIMMLNSIFTAALKNKPKQKETEGNYTKKEVSEESHPKALLDRRNKSARTAYVVIDQDNMVICMLCNQKVNSEKWNEHNEKVHYNLAWREGETEVNMNDSAFIMKRLKPILQKQKSVNCNKCGKKNTNVKDFIEHREVCSGIVSSTGFVICAVCNTEMVKSKWSFHKQKQHNNLAWRVGDHPLDLNDQSLVLAILNALYKAKKPLHCEKCGILKKSVIGFLSHQGQCGSVNTEEAKVKCEFCDRKVLPVSMISHIKLVHEAPKKEQSTGKGSDYFDVNLDSSLSQRKAAKMALKRIDKFSKNKIDQDHKHYIAQADFTKEGFITPILQKELSKYQIIKCKFNDCEFVTDEVNILLNHMNVCERKPELFYVCQKCFSIHDSEDKIKEHIKTTHNIDVIEDDFKVEYEEESDEDTDDNKDDELFQNRFRKKIFSEKKKLEADINYKVKPSFLFATVKKPHCLFSHAFAFTMEFCQENFSQSLLFDELRNLKTDCTLLNDEMIYKYLPQSEESCSVAIRTVKNFENVVGFEYTFKNFELFESNSDKGNVTLFCGGPVYSMAWLPTPYTGLNSKQVLAVAAGKCFEEKHLVNETYSEPSLIQFWDFGVLKNNADMSTPKLMFCLAFDFGPVWHLEWCPSGCYDDIKDEDKEKNSRMGLLAVAGSDSAVYIYSIPFFNDEEMGLIYQLKPLLKLQLLVDEELIKKKKFFASKISWSMTRGHRHVAVGYTDGMVGLYDMDTNSKLLKSNDGNVNVLFPYKLFQAHTYYISALNWVPLMDGNRWLMTASFDRNTYIWDLSNGSKMSISKKIIITDGIWLTNWISFATSADESSTNCHSVHAAVQPYRGYMYDHAYVMICPTTISSISSSSWLNSIIQGNTVGEITATFPHQMLYNLNSEKCWKSLRYYFGYTKLIDKYKSPKERVEEEKLATDTVHKAIATPAATGLSMNSLMDDGNSHYSKYEPISYKEAKQKYGLLFCDMKKENFSDLPKKTRIQELSFSKPNLYSLQKINKIVYNPNRQASLYYATGYQAGFVRVTYLKFLEKDQQVVGTV